MNRRRRTAGPAALVAWRPSTDDPDARWSHSELAMAIAYAEAGRTDAAIDALDDARALGGGTKAGLLLDGPLRDVLLAPLGGPAAPEELDVARVYRQLPDGRDAARRLIDEALAADADDRVARRESGAWWLGQGADPASRERAAAELSAAAAGPGGASARVLLALLRRDATLLPPDDARASPDPPPRVAVARAAIGARSRPMGWPGRPTDRRPP